MRKPILMTAVSMAVLAVGAGFADESGWTSLFDGKTLDGWTVRGGHATYQVEDGAIVGTTGTSGPNTFLCRGPYGDFELELHVLCDTPLNSGIQIRSHVYEKDTPQESKSTPKKVRKAGEVYGYQCEIAEASRGTAGNFWDEARRTRWLDDFSSKPEARAAYKDGQWNHYRIVAQGRRIRSWVNGVPCADFEDDRDASGFIGLQVHTIKAGTGPYRVRWRDIKIRELKSASDESTSSPPRAYIDGTGPGWRELGEADFENVNCDPQTWTFKDGMIHGTGQPVGVMRTKAQYKNFELVAQWRHLRAGGNSGIFVWASESALQGIKPGTLPRGGIEVQMLDHGFAEQFEKRTGKKGNFFTTHGDVFAVGKSRMKPFPPLSPNGSRSFPSKHLSRGVGEWNHYYVRGINGEVRLWVNGEEVSGGTGCEPSEGYLCLESEGSPVEFRQIRVRTLP